MSGSIIKSQINQINNGVSSTLVAELHTGYMVLGDHQRFKGYTLFLCKQDATELHQLEKFFKIEFLEEMSLVAECVWEAFKPQKLNYELLGNGDPHLHWHIFPRFSDDSVKGPVWWLPFKEMQVELPKEEMQKLKHQLLLAVKNNKEIQSHIIKLTN